MHAAVAAAKWLEKHGVAVSVEPETARHVDLPMVSAEEFQLADLVIAFGGDGTLIRAAHLCSETGTPILGVYYGRFGFVTQCTDTDLYECLRNAIAGQITVESRLMLEASVMRSGNAVATLHALNEAVVQRSISARMMTFGLAVDGFEVTTYPADGVMVSTPTGSTAYNLSVGGPVVDPTVQVLILSAIAPHTMSERSFVLAPESVVTLSVQSNGGEAILSADGQTRLHILEGDKVRIRRSDRVTNLLRVQEGDFLIKLGNRLLWQKGLFQDPD